MYILQYNLSKYLVIGEMSSILKNVSIIKNNVFIKKNKTLILLTIFLIVIGLIFYSMSSNKISIQYQSVNEQQDLLIEGFKNNLKDLMDGGKRIRRENFNKKQAKKSEYSKLFERLSKAEKMYDMNDRSMEHFKDRISKYYKSFNREKFTDVPKNTRLSLQKFKHFKKAFWDIFKD